MQNTTPTANAVNTHTPIQQNFQSSPDTQSQPYHSSVDLPPLPQPHPSQPEPPQPQAAQRPFSFSSNYSASRFRSAAAVAIAAVNSSQALASLSPTKFANYTPTNAFAIFNHTNGTVNGHSAHGTHFIDGSKPNAIVRPIRRAVGDAELQPVQQAFNEPATHAESVGRAGGGVGGGPALPLHMHEYQFTAARYLPQNLYGAPADHSAGYAFQSIISGNHNNNAPESMSDRNFADELNRKLRFLRNKENQEVWSKSKNSSRNGSHREVTDKRPLFITTVPTGVFLPPAKEVPLPATLLRQRIYAYATQPVVYSYKSDYNVPLVSTAPGYSSSSPPNTNHHNNNKNNNSSSLSKSLSQLRQTQTGPGRLTTQNAPIAGGVHLSKQQFQQQIQQHRTKREPQEPYKNLMIDKRVVRGSNFASSRLVEEYDPLNKEESRFRPNFRWKCRNQRNVLGTPPPVAGRRHEVIQTEKYLEELVRKPIETSVDTQTDLFLQVPPQPVYKPAKVGVDVGTAIEDGELFHFDAEAQPLIDVLVDSCIEQTMLEVSHEEEIAKLRKKQEEFLAQREAELAELRRLEAEEIRISEERKAREHQEGVVKNLEREMAENVTAAKLLQGHIASLMPEILDNIEPMTDEVGKEKLMNTVCPWLSVEVAEEVGQIVDSREILTVIIQEIIKQRAETYMPLKAATPSLSEIPTEGGDHEEEHEPSISCNCSVETESQHTDAAVADCFAKSEYK